MTLLRWQQTVTDEAGNVLAGASIEIRDEQSGALIPLFEDRAGTVSKGNPFTVDSNGYGFAFLAPTRFKVTATSGTDVFTWPDVLLPEGPLASSDAGEGSDLVAHTGTSDTVTEALDKRTIFVGSVAELVQLTSLTDGAHYSITGYQPLSDIGGGTFYWDASRSKTQHNGGTVIDPDKAFPADWSVTADVAAWFTAGTTGTGCFVRRLEKEYVLAADFGAVANGNTSYLSDTLAVQAAMDAVSSVCLTDGDYTINAAGINTGLRLNSNQLLWFTPNARLVASESNSSDYKLLLLQGGVSNIVLWEPKVMGDRDYNTSPSGEQGHGLWAVDAHNVKIKGGYFKNCFGDGLLVGGGAGQECSDWIVDDVVSQNNRRQGLSITGGIDLTFNNCKFLDTNGTAPEYGVDIEPNTTDRELSRIVFNNCYASGNSGAGFGLIGVEQTTDVDIRFNNCHTKGNFFSVKQCSGSGVVQFNDCSSSQTEFYGLVFSDTTIRCELDGHSVFDPNQARSTNAEIGSGIAVILGVSNVKFNGKVIVSNPDTTDMTSALYASASGAFITDTIFDLETNANRENCLAIRGAPAGLKVIPRFNREGVFNGNIAGNSDVQGSEIWYPVLTNEGVTFSLNYNMGTVSNFENNRIGVLVYEEGESIQLDLDSATVKTGGYNRYVSSSAGSFIELEYRKGFWWVIEEIGTWTGSVI